jgi:hypothetical protein
MSNLEPQATVAGDAAAAYRSAVLAAAGIDRPMDLNGSLAYLQESAQAGHRPAQAELAALAGNWRLTADIVSGKAPARTSWASLRSAIDVAAWLRIPDGHTLSEEPRIASVRRFISTATCDWLVKLGKPHLKKATIYNTQSGGLEEDRVRTNTAADLNLERFDVVLGFLRARIAALAELPTVALESSQILHYDVGEEFSLHHDFLDVSFPGLAEQVASHGQRALTLLIYLNDGYEGGETAFPLLGKSFKGRKGDALVFWNVLPDGAPDRRTLHAGTAPTRGEKWLFSQWIRVRAS